MPTHQLPQFLHWGIWQIPGGKSQGTFQGPPPPYTSTAPPWDTLWTPINLALSTRKLTASPGLSRNQCSSVFRIPPQQKSGQIPAAAYMGLSSTSLTNIPMQANTTAIVYYQHLTPLLVQPPTTTLPLPIRWGPYFSFIIIPYGK